MNDLVEIVLKSTVRTTNGRTNLIKSLCEKFGWTQRSFEQAIDRMESGLASDPEEESAIYTVEHREWVTSTIPDVMDCVAMAAFSTLANAEIWVANVRNEGGWYVIFKERLDPPPAEISVSCKIMGIFDSAGCRIEEQPERPRGTKMLCEECGEPSELYMLKDDLWSSLGYRRNNVSCMACVTKKLKRKIRRSDLRKSLIQAGWMNHFELD